MEPIRPAYVYILGCADGTLYVGWTYQVRRRLRRHNAGHGSRYTRARRPVRLVYLQRCASRSAAQRRELEIRRLTRAEKLGLIDEKRRARLQDAAAWPAND